MAYSIVLSGAADQGGPEVFELCSVGAWGLFAAWAKALDAPTLHKLVSGGSVEGTDALSSELLDAREIDPPQDPGVLATLDALIERVGVGASDETITVSDE